MSETEIREFAWRSSVKRIVAMIDEYSQGWEPIGPSKTTADAIINKIKNMPVPHPDGGRP